eukprot:tig00001029_g6429.t1
MKRDPQSAVPKPGIHVCGSPDLEARGSTSAAQEKITGSAAKQVVSPSRLAQPCEPEYGRIAETPSPGTSPKRPRRGDVPGEAEAGGQEPAEVPPVTPLPVEPMALPESARAASTSRRETARRPPPAGAAPRQHLTPRAGLGERADLAGALAGHGPRPRATVRTPRLPARAPRPGSRKPAADLSERGERAYVEGEYGRAEKLLGRALALREEHLGRAHAETLACALDLAAALLAQGRFPEAAPLAAVRPPAPAPAPLRGPAARARGARGGAAGRGGGEAEVARAARLLGDAYAAMGKLAKAAAAYQRALAALGAPGEAGEGEGEEALEVCGALAEVERERGHAGEAHQLLERVLAGTRYEEQTVQLLQAAAEAAEEAARLERAEELHRRVLALQAGAGGGEGAEAGWTLNTLALLCEAQGRPADAERLYRRATAVLEKALGAEHPNAAAAHSNLGAFLLKQGRAGEAVGPLQYALLVSEAVLGPLHEDTRDTAAWLADAYEGSAQAPQAAVTRAKHRLTPAAPRRPLTAQRAPSRPVSCRSRARVPTRTSLRCEEIADSEN